jgi:hypothetical protein
LGDFPPCLLLVICDEMGNRPKFHRLGCVERQSKFFEQLIAAPQVADVR